MSRTYACSRGVGIFVFVGALGFLLAGAGVSTAATAPSLAIQINAAGHPTISAGVEVDPPQVLVIERGANLGNWSELWRIHGPVENVADFTPSDTGHSFYRAWSRPRVATDDWKSLVAGQGDEAFLSEPPPFGSASPRWIKFAFLRADPSRIYFQDSTKFPFHYDFAVERLPQFKGMTRAQFDAVTLRTNGQMAVLGAVLVPSTGTPNEVALQFVGQDAYPREWIADWSSAVGRVILGGPGMRRLYFPTFEQAGVAREHEDWLRDHGVTVGGVGRWIVSDQCYASGWALGRLRFVPGTNIVAAYREGQLLPGDILLTDGVPAEVPPLAGILSLSPSTPNSHVALLSKSFGMPFVHLANPSMAETLKAWEGRDVLVRAVDQFGGCEASVEALAGTLDPSLRNAILATKEPPALDLPRKMVSGSLTLSVENLGPQDAAKVGGKAANLGVLRRAIPTNAPSPAVAITFDLWDEFMAQEIPGRGKLGDAIAAKLGTFQWPPPMVAMQEALAEVRSWIKDDADFGAATKQALLAALQAAGFETTRNLRFRSSTNVEDSEQFSGAGLYDSFSGCMADDLDANNAGPSHCDPTEPAERGAFRALRKVFASFYNDNAFLERLRHRVDETAVGMAVLVHVSTPDDVEEANGVVTLKVHREGNQHYISGSMVSQVGAVSVTNPDQSASPERVDISDFGFGSPYFEVQARSSLVPLGSSVLRWPDEYQALYALLVRAAIRWEGEMPKRDEWLLDFEYKRETPGILKVKQMRPLPPPPADQPVTPWLVNVTNRWVIQQGEHGDLLSFHRLKSSWLFETRNLLFAGSNLAAATPFRAFDATWLDGTNVVAAAGVITNLPGYKYAFDNGTTKDSWGDGANRRSLELSTDFYARAARGPVATLSDFRLLFRTVYATPQPALMLEGLGEISLTTTTEDWVFLVPWTPVTAESLRQERSVQLGSKRVDTTFYWPPPPKGVVAGYTAPVQGWVETRLEGFTSMPVILKGDDSQTYHPGHHNFWEEFLFDPWLEPGLSAAQLEELRLANIRAILVTRGSGFPPDAMFVLGLDGKLRPL
ncbi:MAG: hypothetical protein IT581_09405 [Verrucomicrobiales bacterium]|nr:hypothetical protein [Verrucomicrobiales bacterium]